MSAEDDNAIEFGPGEGEWETGPAPDEGESPRGPGRGADPEKWPPSLDDHRAPVGDDLPRGPGRGADRQSMSPRSDGRVAPLPPIIHSTANSMAEQLAALEKRLLQSINNGFTLAEGDINEVRELVAALREDLRATEAGVSRVDGLVQELIRNANAAVDPTESDDIARRLHDLEQWTREAATLTRGAAGDLRVLKDKIGRAPQDGVLAAVESVGAQLRELHAAVGDLRQDTGRRAAATELLAPLADADTPTALETPRSAWREPATLAGVAASLLALLTLAALLLSGTGARVDELAARVRAIPTQSLDESQLRKALREAGTTAADAGLADKVDALAAKLDAALTNRATPAPGGQQELAREAADAAVAAASAKLQALAAEQGKPGPAEPVGPGADLAVVALHSESMNVNDHVKALNQLVGGLPKVEAKGAAPRVRLFVVTTAALPDKEDWPNAGGLSANFGPPNRDATEAPARFGKDLYDRFEPSRPVKRAVLLASTACPALEPDAGGWKDLTGVDVVLVQKADRPEAQDAANLVKWLRFCGERNGTLRVVWAGDGQRERLRDGLVECCGRAGVWPPGERR